MWLSSNLSRCSDGHNDGSDHAEQTKHFGEDENKNESDKDLLVDCIELDALLTNETDCVSSCDIADTTQGTSAELQERSRCSYGAGRYDFLREKHCDDQAIDRENTSHNNGDDRLEGEMGSSDRKRGNAHARLGRAISCAEVAESHRKGDSAPSKEVEAYAVVTVGVEKWSSHFMI